MSAGGNEEGGGRKRQKPKKGRVIRLTPDLVTIVAAEQERGEKIPDVLRRLLGLKGEVRYVLPSDVHETVEEARGEAVIRAVRRKLKRPEKPITMRKVKC